MPNEEPGPCPDVRNLPSILEPLGRFEVRAPGSIYQPLLLNPREDSINVGPGKLDKNEEAFVRDLIKFLYPDGSHPEDENMPLEWEGKELWLKRNLPNDNQSFRLRVDDSDWFYPDFILWILDKENKVQTLGFVDPKGLAIGTTEGWSDYKIVSTLYVSHVVEMQLRKPRISLLWQGEEWTFRVRGVLVSTSDAANLISHAKFRLRDDNGNDIAPTEADFERARIVFQKSDPSYVDVVLNLLTEDTTVDALVKSIACIQHASTTFTPKDESEYDIALRHHERTQSESEFVGELIRDYLKLDPQGNSGVWPRKHRQRELLELCPEKATSFINHSTPCEELWKQKDVSAGPILGISKPQ